MSEIFVKLLNSKESPFESKTTEETTESAAKSEDSSGSSAFSENTAQEIRQCTIYSIIQRIGADYTFDQQRSALECLTELPDDAQILSVMTRPSNLEQIKQFLQIDDENVKATCFRLLQHLLKRTFAENSSGEAEDEWNSFAPEKTDAEKAEEREFSEIKKSAREELFQFMGTIVQLVI